MKNLSITEAEVKSLIKAATITACLTITLTTTTIVFIFDLDVLSSALRSLSLSIAITSGLFTLFVRSAWRWPLVASWMQRPLVEGVWAGWLTTDFRPTERTKNSTMNDIPIVFVIRQTYLSISVQSYTQNQEGESRLEALIRNSKTDVTNLSYVFELRRPYTLGGKLARGAGELKLVSNEKELRGLYWTDTPTHGRLNLTKMSDQVEGISCFDDATKKWPTIKSRAFSKK